MDSDGLNSTVVKGCIGDGTVTDPAQFTTMTSDEISQFGPFGDMSDGITMFQQLKIITDLFSISQSYLGRSVLVKP